MLFMIIVMLLGNSAMPLLNYSATFESISNSLDICWD